MPPLVAGVVVPGLGSVPGTRNAAVIAAVPEVAVVPVEIAMGIELLPMTHSHESGPIFGAVVGVGAVSARTSSFAAASELLMSKRT